MEDEVNNLANNQDLQNNENVGLNTDFQESELDGAIYRLKLGKSPSPDSLYPEMLHNASESKQGRKDQESTQSSTTPKPGYQWESDKPTVRHHKREPSGQPFPSR